MTSEIDKYLQIQADIEQAYKTAARAKRDQHRATRAYRIDVKVFWLGVVAPAVLSILIVLASLIESFDWMPYASWGLIGLSYVVMFIYPLLCAWLYRASVSRLVTAPFASLLEANVTTVMKVDAQHLPLLKALSSETLKLGALELKSERGSLEKRTHLVTGALEKIGILPGFFAFAVGGVTLAKNLTDTGFQPVQMEWLYSLAVGNVFFYILCGYAQMILVRYDRMIALTELAILQKESSPGAG